MFIQTRQLTLSRALVASLLSALETTTTAPLLTTPRAHLFTAFSGIISPTSAVADFTEATFAGYASVLITGFAGPVNLAPQYTIGVHTECDWVAGAIVAPGQTVLGYWLDDGAGHFLAGERFLNPVGFVAPGDFLSLDIVIPLTAVQFAA